MITRAQYIAALEIGLSQEKEKLKEEVKNYKEKNGGTLKAAKETIGGLPFNDPLVMVLQDSLKLFNRVDRANCVPICWSMSQLEVIQRDLNRAIKILGGTNE